MLPIGSRGNNEMGQRRLGLVYAKIEGDKSYGFKQISFIKSDTAFSTAAGAVAGQVRYDTSLASLVLWNGSAEISLPTATLAGVLGATSLTVSGTAVVTGGVSTKVGTTADLTGTPTDAELSTAFGVANKTRAGFLGIVVDSSDGKTYFVCSNGTTWQYVALTTAT